MFCFISHKQIYRDYSNDNETYFCVHVGWLVCMFQLHFMNINTICFYFRGCIIHNFIYMIQVVL